MGRHRHIARPALLPFSPFYGLAVMFRNFLFDLNILKSVSFKIPVISVGNITVGGTGKTPHVEYLIKLLRDDHNLALLSRGYKRKTRGFVLASKKSAVYEVGDEPLQIKLKYPDIQVAVDHNRVNGVRTLIDTIRKLDLVILDDAFQHRYIRPGLSILLVDYNRPIFQDMILPAGNLRESWRNGRRAHVIIITKCPAHITPRERAGFISRLHPGHKQEIYFSTYNYCVPQQVFAHKHNPQARISYKHLIKSGAGILLVTGIADPEPLKQFLKTMLIISEELTFADHHNYNNHDLQVIKDKFEAMETAEKYIIVTEKDAMRLREMNIADQVFREAFYFIPVEVQFLAKGEKPFIKRIHKFLKKASRK